MKKLVTTLIVLNIAFIAINVIELVRNNKRSKNRLKLMESINQNLNQSVDETKDNLKKVKL